MSVANTVRRLLSQASLILLVFLLFAFQGVRLAHAQRTWANPVVYHPIFKGISPPLREIPPGIALTRNLRPLRHPFPLSPMTSFNDPVAQTVAGPMVSTSSGSDFDGIAVGADAAAVAPPDPNLSVGDTQVVQWVNTEFEVLDKATGALLYGPAAGNTLWNNTGGGACQLNNDGDPIVLFDKAAHRWVMTQLAVSGGPPYYQCVAVSTTNDATGPFVRYIYQMPNFNDYPKLGVWSDGYYMSFNIFQDFIIFSTFQGALPCALDRNAMLTGQSASMVCFQLSSSYASLLPGDLDGSTPAVAGSPGLFLSLNTNSLDLWRFHADFSNTSNSQLTGPINIPVASFSQACGGGTCIPQAGTTQQLDSLGDRLMYRLPYRNFGDHEALVANHSVTVGSSAGVRWYEIRSPFSTPSVFQQGTYAPDNNFRWMGSIGMDEAGDIAMGYSESSSTMNPSINYTGRVPGDAPGTMEGENVIISGTGSQNGGLSRWGDYTAISIDPTNDCTFWYTDEYLQQSGSFNWSTRIASFSFPACGGTVSTASQTSLSSSSNPSSYGQSVTFTATVTVSGGPPTGSVTFYDGGVSLGSKLLSSGSQVSIATSTLAVGTHSITAAYSGDSNYTGSTSNALSQTVKKDATTTGLTSSLNPAKVGQVVNFTATVTPSAATGTVTFLNGSTVMGSAAVISGQAQFSTSFKQGSYSITASYGGDATFAGSTSPVVTEKVTRK